MALLSTFYTRDAYRFAFLEVLWAKWGFASKTLFSGSPAFDSCVYVVYFVWFSFYVWFIQFVERFLMHCSFFVRYCELNCLRDCIFWFCTQFLLYFIIIHVYDENIFHQTIRDSSKVSFCCQSIKFVPELPQCFVFFLFSAQEFESIKCFILWLFKTFFTCFDLIFQNDSCDV